ncbi:hypothetical protein AS850_09495 [Frondihabitans sp. 762G35]|uniref:hypothetical protein n=1 Tax=Frondihabitans sp. 762G35 TaxID=1446794 RepID=UPI000D22654D|nr:hypothetical protein [Frondihabitans sp. 762G35]ARC57309.1 hypothetical protein AS850_09495 [Frondihabitans sp. 762G35]
MKGSERRSRAAPRAKAAIRLGALNAAAAAGLGLTIWTYAGTNDGPACEVSCGSGPDIVVALATGLISLGLWIITVFADVAVLIGGQPRRDVALVGLIVLVAPVASLLVASRLSG